MDVHTESISICVRNSLGKIVMEGVIETKASTILQFLDGRFKAAAWCYSRRTLSMAN